MWSPTAATCASRPGIRLSIFVAPPNKVLPPRAPAGGIGSRLRRSGRLPSGFRDPACRKKIEAKPSVLSLLTDPSVGTDSISHLIPPILMLPFCHFLTSRPLSRTVPGEGRRPATPSVHDVHTEGSAIALRAIRPFAQQCYVVQASFPTETLRRITAGWRFFEALGMPVTLRPFP